MTRDRRSNRMKPNCPPAGDPDVWAATITGALGQAPKHQIQALLIASQLGCRGDEAPAAPLPAYSAAQTDRMAHRRKHRRHSTPIAVAVPAAA
jgi:hypothetical protein